MGSADARGVGVVCRRVFRFRSPTALLDDAARGTCESKHPIYPQQSNTVSDQEAPIQNVSMNSMNNDLIYILSLSCFKQIMTT